MSEPIKFSRTRDLFGWCSNFAPYPTRILVPDPSLGHLVEVCGKTSEHVYQAMKFWYTDPAYSRQILQITRPGDAALLGRVNAEMRDMTFDTYKDALMSIVCLAKMTQNNLEEWLLLSEEREIQEDSPKDYYWGVGADGTGRNQLGKTWMVIRQHLKEGTLQTYHDNISLEMSGYVVPRYRENVSLFWTGD